ncbi:hypothetical protein SK128_020179 [Halocaridina rubra]|uniref:Uncharacterized protein n=1 Tax=Halocaridina rubra TaxID=373956 RepID=A0AAN8X2P2_HALRR
MTNSSQTENKSQIYGLALDVTEGAAAHPTPLTYNPHHRASAYRMQGGFWRHFHGRMRTCEEKQIYSHGRSGCFATIPPSFVQCAGG